MTSTTVVVPPVVAPTLAAIRGAETTEGGKVGIALGTALGEPVDFARLDAAAGPRVRLVAPAGPDTSVGYLDGASVTDSFGRAISDAVDKAAVGTMVGEPDAMEGCVC